MIRKLRKFFTALGLLTALVVPIAMVFLRRRTPGNVDAVEDARKTLEQVQGVVAEAIRAQGDRQARAEAAKKKLEKIMTGALVLALCLVTFPAMATGQDIYIPESYDELLEYYLAAIEVAQEYRALYEEAEAEVDRLLGQIEILDTEVERLAKYIERHCQPAWGLTAGIDLADGARWQLGVSRKSGILSFGGGVSGGDEGDEFGVWGSMTLWLQNPF